MHPFYLIQVTDNHLGGRPSDTMLGLDTGESLCDVLDMIKREESPNMILNTGDISDDGSIASYERFIDYIRKYYPDDKQVPLAWLPGNHDDPTNMDLVDRPVPIEAHVTAAGWNLIFLDSRIPMQEGGNLNASELRRLESELRKHRSKPTLIFLHHQIVPVGSAWVDSYLVDNHKEFFDIIDQFDNVKGVCWGHVHQEFNSRRKGVALMATPSTCIQFTPRLDDFKVDDKMPGYRVFKLYPDGRFTTKVRRIPHKDYPIDFDSDGY